MWGFKNRGGGGRGGGFGSTVGCLGKQSSSENSPAPFILDVLFQLFRK